MATYHLQIAEQRPFFAELPYYLWGEVNYDSDGDCARPTDCNWTHMYVKNRDTGDVVEFGSEGTDWTVSGPEPHAQKAALFLVYRSAASPKEHLPLAVDSADHEAGIARAKKVADEFGSPQLKLFDSHLFWGSWKWIGWFATEFTWVGRWIMHSVVRNDPRAISLCIDWLRQGTCSKEQSAALRDALRQLTGAAFEEDAKWLKWYDGGLLSRGQKAKYPEPDFQAWLADLKAQASVG